MARSWTEFLRGSSSSGHAVQIYVDVDELAESVAAYLAAGFEAGEPAVVVATPDHGRRFAEQLAAAGWDAPRIDREELLVVADAEATLAQFMGGSSPDAKEFQRAVGGLLDRAEERFPGRPIRVFGEMVDLLNGRGQPAAALAVEELWNSMARKRRFSLLCGYQMNVFDRVSQVWPLPVVCRLHSHVLPAHDAARLTQAVDRALEEVLGPTEAGKVYVLVGEQTRDERVPTAQLALMWVSANMPVVADRILATARGHYFAEPLASVGT